MWQRFFQAFLMALLLLGMVAWVQGRDDLQDQGQQQPLQTDMANKDQQSLDLSIDRHNSKDSDRKSKDRKAVRATDIKKSPETGDPKTESFGPSFGQYGMSNPQSRGPQFGASGSGLIGKGYNQSSSFGSTSFLDGYLLKSLHDEGISKKKTSNEEKPKDALRPRGKTAY